MLLKECLHNVKEIGLQQKVIISDRGSNNVGLYKRLGISWEVLFFVHEDDKVFCMHDLPHLLSNTRSNLEKYVFQVDRENEMKHIR